MLRQTVRRQSRAVSYPSEVQSNCPARKSTILCILWEYCGNWQERGVFKSAEKSVGYVGAFRIQARKGQLSCRQLFEKQTSCAGNVVFRLWKPIDGDSVPESQMFARKGLIPFVTPRNGSSRGGSMARLKGPHPGLNTLCASEKSLSAALFNSAIGVAVTDAEGRFLLVNEVCCRLTGYTEQELLSREWSFVIHPEDRTDVSSGILEKRCRKKDGTEVWVRTSISRVQESDKPVLFVVLAEDITERKRAEQALAERDIELKAAQRLAQMGSWQWDPSTDAVIWSDELYRATGYDPKLPPPVFQQHDRFFTPESWKRLTQSVDETLRTGVPYERELEFVRLDGSRGWAISRGEAVRDAQGQIVRLRGTILDITRQRKAEQAAATSEEKFAKAFDLLPVALHVVSLAEGRQIAVNEALLRMTGYTRDEVIGRNYLELGYWDDPRDRQRIADRLSAGENIRNAECRFRTKNGELRIGLLSAELIDIDGEPCAIGAIIDITDLRRAEESVRNLESKLALHFRQTLIGVVEFDEHLRIVEWNPAAEAIFGYVRQEVIGRDALELIVPEKLRAELSSVCKEILTKDGVRYSGNANVTKDGREIICEWFNTPLVQADGRVSGVISLVRDVTAEKRTQSDLTASEATLSAIFQSTDDGIWTVDSERFGLMTFNSAVREELAGSRGFEPRVGMTPDDLVPAESAAWWKDSYGRALREGRFETDYMAADRVSVFRVSFNPLYRDGKIFGISVFARNATKRRQAERALRASEQRYRHIVESSSDWVWEVDINGCYTYVSPQCAKILGYAPRELIGKTVFDLMPQKEGRRVARLFVAGRLFDERAAHPKPFRRLEIRIPHKDGHMVFLEMNGAPMFDEQGVFQGYRGMGRDITERKNAEEALRESERRLHLALESGRMYAFEWDKNTDLMVRSAEAAPALCVPEFPVQDTGRDFLNRLHSDDRSRYVDALSRLTPEQSDYHAEYREILPGGRLCWIESRGRGFFNTSRELVRVVGIAADITARKEAEEALRTVSAYLINTQEEERKRIARELHDGVSQALAVISIEMVRAAKAAAGTELSASLQNLCAKLQSVASDIGQLSHELHPATISHLGLSSAIRVLCDEIRQTHGIEVTFTDNDAPQPSSKDAALCLYRVAQEALHNVVRHSGSKKAWVQLKGKADGMCLEIRDKGVGFDVRSAPQGLGLISMRERLRLIGGSIVISSRRNRGTRVEAHVPISCEHKAAA